MALEDLRVLVFCSSNSWGGLEMNTVRYAGWMRERGINVTVAAVADTPLMKAAQASDLACISIRRNRKYFDVTNAIRLARIIRDEKPTHLWFRDNRDMDLIGWAKRMGRHRTKVVYHQAMQLGVSKKDFIHTWRFRAVDHWIALLDYLKEQVVTHTRFPERRISVIPLGHPPARFSPDLRSPSEARRILGLPDTGIWAGIIGRLDELKGQHLLIEAAGRLRDAGHPVQVLILGESTRNESTGYEGRLRQRVTELNLEDRVHFRPYRKEVEVAYRALDVFVLASTGETFGNVTVEAMLSRTAVLGSNASGTPEILDYGKAGALFEPGSIDALTRELAKLIESPSLRKRLADAGHARATQRFSQQAVMERITALLLQD